MSETREARAARLKAALRDNLKRRKAQMRARADGPVDRAEAGPAAPAPEDGGGTTTGRP